MCHKKNEISFIFQVIPIASMMYAVGKIRDCLARECMPKNCKEAGLAGPRDCLFP